MARLARRRRGRVLAAAAVVATAALPLAGCTTTQHQAQRLQLDSARQRAALRPTRVAVASTTVRPSSVAVLSSGGKTAFVVRVSNHGARAVTDLPISVGYEQAGGARVYLNAVSGIGYFQAHLPAIRAHRSLTWVYTTGRALPRGARAFAVVGGRRSAPGRLTEMDVRIRARYDSTTDSTMGSGKGSGKGSTAGEGSTAGQDSTSVPAAGPAADSVSVRLDNPTDVPQYELQVYAFARAHGRYVAAGTATVAELGAGARRRVRLRLTVLHGHAGTAAGELRVEAPPTILQ